MEKDIPLSNEILARSGLYELFSRVLLTELDVNTITLFQADNWQAALQRLGITIPEPTDDNIELLAIDYCHIFVGPKNFCPPFQSVWQTGQLQSLVIDSMNEFLKVIKPKSTVQIKDHAGVQLEMMALVLQNQDATNECEGLAEAFFSRHLSWTENLFSKAARLAETNFYQSILDTGADFISAEKSLVFGQSD